MDSKMERIIKEHGRGLPVDVLDWHDDDWLRLISATTCLDKIWDLSLVILEYTRCKLDSSKSDRFVSVMKLQIWRSRPTCDWKTIIHVMQQFGYTAISVVECMEQVRVMDFSTARFMVELVIAGMKGSETDDVKHEELFSAYCKINEMLMSTYLGRSDGEAIAAQLPRQKVAVELIRDWMKRRLDEQLDATRS